MFQAPVAVCTGVQHEQVLFEWRLAFSTMPKGHFCFANGLGVAQQALAVEPGAGAAHHEAVRYAAHLEGGAPELAHFHRAVGEFVVVARQVNTKAVAFGFARSKSSGQLPAFGVGVGHHFQRMGLVFTAVYTQAQAGGVEEASGLVQEGGTYRRVKGVDLVTQGQFRAVFACCHFPAVLVQLLQGCGLTITLGAQALQVLGKFTHQVATGNPGGQAHALAGGWPVNTQRDCEQVGVRVEYLYTVAQGRTHLALASSCSTLSAPAAPGMRVPSTKKVVGVPVMRCF